jgi:hypothetical protein
MNGLHREKSIFFAGLELSLIRFQETLRRDHESIYFMSSRSVKGLCADAKPLSDKIWYYTQESQGYARGRMQSVVEKMLRQCQSCKRNGAGMEKKQQDMLKLDE